MTLILQWGDDCTLNMPRCINRCDKIWLQCVAYDWVTMSSGFKRDFRNTDRVLGRDEYRAGKSEIVLHNGQPKPKTLGPRQLEK